jgi:hypothetical protein
MIARLKCFLARNRANCPRCGWPLTRTHQQKERDMNRATQTTAPTANEGVMPVCDGTEAPGRGGE